MSARRYLWGMVVVLLAAAALRTAAFGALPPGLYHDEAFHGLDALEVLDGWLPLYFPANNGREPLFIYLVTAAVGVLGRSPFALRLPALFAGVLSVAATAAAGRALFSRRVGLLAAGVLAVTLWHVHLSRVGFRAVLLPLFLALAAWQAARGVGTGRARNGLAAGALYGLSFYTYTAARFTPVALAVLVLYLLLRPGPRELARWRGPLLLAALALLVSLLPLGVYTLAQPEAVLGRPGQVGVFNPAIHGGDPWGTLARHVLRTLGMFFVRGDRIWRHNVPWRPVFDPLLGAAFLLGLVVAARRARREPAAALVLVWTAVMGLPTVLAEDAPHFLRSVGMLPGLVFLPALGLDLLVRQAGERTLPGRGLAALVLLFGLASTARAYFGPYAHDPTTAYWFERGATALGARINAFLGVGWDGERTLRGDPGERRVFLDPGLWEEWEQVRFLVAAPQAVTLGLEGEPQDGPVAVFVWPYGEWHAAWSLLPSPVEIAVEEGPRSQGDRDPEPFTTYLALLAAPPDPSIPAQARFEGGVELLDVSLVPLEGDRLQARLVWRATGPPAEDYTVFVHYLREGERVAQADGRPAGGHYPTTRWRAGDVIHDDHLFEGVSHLLGSDALLFGLWDPESGTRLRVLDEASNPAGDWILLPVEQVLQP